jgi:hypothetical protein
LKLFPEIEVPTKGFGAFARRFGRPTFITAQELDRALRSDEDWIVLDSRPPAEYRKGNIPGSIDAPGADLNPAQVEVELWRADELEVHRGLNSELDEMWRFVVRKSNPRWL